MSCPEITSTTRGHMVPNSIVAADAHKKILFNNSPPSLEIIYMFFLFSILSNFMAYNNNEPEVTTTKKIKIKTLN